MTTKETPILFRAPMVRAILAGTKTVTRRPVKPQPPHSCRYEINGAGTHALCLATRGGRTVFVPPTASSVDHRLACRYGGPGDVLWVKETWGEDYTALAEVTVGQHQKLVPVARVVYRADGHAMSDAGAGWRPSIFMPRWACRLLLRVESVSIERVQDLTEAEALAEGIDSRADFGAGWRAMYRAKPDLSWDADPWVWVIRFSRVAAPRQRREALPVVAPPDGPL